MNQLYQGGISNGPLPGVERVSRAGQVGQPHLLIGAQPFPPSGYTQDPADKERYKKTEINT